MSATRCTSRTAAKREAAYADNSHPPRPRYEAGVTKSVYERTTSHHLSAGIVVPAGDVVGVRGAPASLPLSKVLL